MKTRNISDPIVWIHFIFGLNIALHRAINIHIKNFEKIQNGHHAGTFTPSALQMKALNISKPILQFYFIFGMNVALDRAITIRINNFETNQNGRHAGRFSPSALQMKSIKYVGTYSADLLHFWH